MSAVAKDVRAGRGARRLGAARLAAAALPAALVLAIALLAGCSAPANPADPPAPPGASTAAPADALSGAFAGDIDVRTVDGSRPALSWPEVEGAARYRVTVVQTDGPTWAWSGPDAAVVLGGGAEGREGPGFALTSAATAYIAAFDADGAVLDTGIAELPGP